MSMESIQIKNMYDLNETIAAEIFEGKTYPWEVLPLIKEFIVKLGNTLSPEEYDKIGEDIWVAKSATIAPTVAVNGPGSIGKDAEVRQRVGKCGQHCGKSPGAVCQGYYLALSDCLAVFWQRRTPDVR